MDSTMLLTGAVVALTAALIYYHVKVFSYWRSRGVPGPIPWPLFGTNIYYIFTNKHELDARWRKQYGHTYGLFEGYLPLLRTTDNELIKNIYVKQFGSFTDRNDRFIYGQVQRNWLLWSKGAHWSNQRALVSPMFSSAKMRPMFSSMSDCVDRFLTFQSNKLASPQLSTEFSDRKQEVDSDNGGGGGGGVDAAIAFNKTDLSKMTLDVIATCFFGLKLDTYDVAQNEFLREAYKFARFELSWFIMWLLTPTLVAKYFQLNLFRQSRLQYFGKLTERIIQERRHNNIGGKSDVIQAFIDAKLPSSGGGAGGESLSSSSSQQGERVFSLDDDKEAHYNDRIGHKELESLQRKQASEAKYFKQFSDIEIQGQMMFMFLAGFETTATTLSFASLELAANLHIQDKLHAELKEAFNCATNEELAEFNFSKQNYSDLLDLKLLDAFVSEVLRLYSPILDHNRLVTDPDGIRVKLTKTGRSLYLAPGMAISTPGFTLQRDGDYFERPNEFDLMRFYGDNRNKIKSATFMPFGLGPRHCAGMRFALLEIKLALAKIISKCIVAPGSQEFTYPPKFQQNAIFLSAENFDFCLKPRVEARRQLSN